MTKLEEQHRVPEGSVAAPSKPELVTSQVTDTLFRSGRSLAALQSASEGLLVWNEAKTFLHCSVCVPEPNDIKKSPQRCI